MARLARRHVVVIVGLAVLLVLAFACAKSEEKTGATAPAAPAAEKAAPQPAAAPAPKPAEAAKPAAAPAPAAAVTATGDKPLVPGGPVFERSKLEKLPGWQIFQQYDVTKLSLWTKAKYGGEGRSSGSITATHTDSLNIVYLHRGTFFGRLLRLDMGLCSMVGREGDFSVCKGQYGKPYSQVVVPDVFHKWEQPDPVTYVFHIRPGVRWPSVPPMARTDRTVTAEDIVWFLEAQKRQGALRDNFTLVKSFEALDRATVKLALLSPNADMLITMAHTSMGLFPKECYEEKDCLKTKVVSPAPFLFTENVPRQRFVLEKNPEFHLKGLPYNDRFVAVFMPDPNAVKAAFYTGQRDGGGADTPEEMGAIVKQVPNARVQAVSVLSGHHAIRFDFRGPFADVRVRRAMAMTVDHPALWQGSHGGYSLFPTLLGRDFFGENFFMSLDQAGQWYQFNPQRAKQLMTEAGYPNGFQTSLETGFGTGAKFNMLISAQAQWKKYLNIDVRIKTVDSSSQLASFYGHKWDGMWFWWCWNISCWADADATFAHFLKGSPLNPQGINDPFIEDLYRKQRGELDPAKRVQLLWDFEQYELDKVYYLRLGVGDTFTISQAWELNAVSHEVAYCSGGGTSECGWLGMIDSEMRKSLAGR